MRRKHEHSQHFLRSPRLVAELIGHSNIRKNDTVYDLGAGSGVISSVLANRCKQVIAVEIEPEALLKLRQNLGNVDNVTILDTDILSLHPERIPYKIFANIPFSISSDVVKKFTTEENSPKAMYLVVQKQFARKITPGNDHFTSALAVQIGPWWTVRVRKPLRKSDFTPPPAVDTVLLEIKRREQPMVDLDQAAYHDWIAKAFSNQKYYAGLPLPEASISPELRPSQLSLEQWLRLYAILHT